MELAELLWRREDTQDYSSLMQDLVVYESSLLRPNPGSGNTSKVLLNGENWVRRALRRAEEGRHIRVLDIGCGDAAPAWTLPLDNPQLDENAKQFRTSTQIENYDLVTHSGLDTESVTPGRRITGHFVEALSQLREEGEQFDIITSRMAVGYTGTILEVLKLIDDLLSPDGAAFIDYLSKGKGEQRVLFFPTSARVGYIIRTKEAQRSLSYQEAGILGLTYTTKPEYGTAVAWEKGAMDRTKMPEFHTLALVEDGIQDFRLLYRISGL